MDCRRSLRKGCLEPDLELLDAIFVGDAGYLFYHCWERFSFYLPVVPGFVGVVWLGAGDDPE
jgi:hypothetical protein